MRDALPPLRTEGHEVHLAREADEVSADVRKGVVKLIEQAEGSEVADPFSLPWLYREWLDLTAHALLPAGDREKEHAKDGKLGEQLGSAADSARFHLRRSRTPAIIRITAAAPVTYADPYW